MSQNRQIVFNLVHARNFFIDYAKKNKALMQWLELDENTADLVKIYEKKFAEEREALPALFQTKLQELLSEAFSEHMQWHCKHLSDTNSSKDFQENILDLKSKLFTARAMEDDAQIKDYEQKINLANELIVKNGPASQKSVDTLSAKFNNFFSSFPSVRRLLESDLMILGEVFDAWNNPKTQLKFQEYPANKKQWENLRDIFFRKLQIPPSEKFSNQEVLECYLSQILVVATDLQRKVVNIPGARLQLKQDNLQHLRELVTVDLANIECFIELAENLASCDHKNYQLKPAPLQEQINKLKATLENYGKKIQKSIAVELEAKLFIDKLKTYIETTEWEVWYQLITTVIRFKRDPNKFEVIEKHVPLAVAEQYEYIQRVHLNEISHLQAQQEIERLGNTARLDNGKWFSTRKESTKTYYGLFAPDKRAELCNEIGYQPPQASIQRRNSN